MTATGPTDLVPPAGWWESSQTGFRQQPNRTFSRNREAERDLADIAAALYALRQFP
jgi:hypothetical protein